MELSEEERETVLANRRKREQTESGAPAGIGTGRIWAQARLQRKRFIDEATFIEKEGKANI